MKLDMRLIDLSHPIEEAMPVFPGSEAPSITAVASVAEDGFREKRIALCSHTGTHLDAPAHVLENGRTLDQLPIGQFAGTAGVLDLRHTAGPEITVKDLEPRVNRVGRCEFYLLHTGWSRYWGSADYYKGFPVLDAGAARFLADLRPKGIGIDAISLDGMDASALAVHKIFLGRNIIIIENLTNLDRLPEEAFKFSCFPLKFREADGSPVRAVAQIP